VTILALLSYSTAAALVVALVACVVRRWQVAAAVSRAVVLSGPVILGASVAVSVVIPMQTADPSMKAVIMSLGLSEALNCGGIALGAAVLGAPVWAVSRGRARASSRRSS